MEIQTQWGFFTIITYELRENLGLEMRIGFTPNDTVDATQIGFVQMVRAWAAAALPPGLPGGVQIDADDNDSNPVYGLTLAEGMGRTLADSDQAPDLVSLGWRTNDTVQVAVMVDYPTVPVEWGAAFQLFETAAVVLAGPQAIRYLGSVTWGWKRDATNRASKRPAALGNAFGTSAIFRQAVIEWNQRAERSAGRLLWLPLPPGRNLER